MIFFGEVRLGEGDDAAPWRLPSYPGATNSRSPPERVSHQAGYNHRTVQPARRNRTGLGWRRVASESRQKRPLGSPPGLVAVFTISGGTALMITAFATRVSPWRAR